ADFAVGGGLDRVSHQVRQDLFHLYAIRSDQGWRRRADAYRHAMGASLIGERAAEPAQDLAKIDRIPTQLAPVKETSNALDDRPGAMGFLFDILHRLAQQLGIKGFLLQKSLTRMSKCRRGRQRLADLVHDRGAERADRGEPGVPGKLRLLMPQELLGVIALGHDGAENQPRSGNDNRQKLAAQEVI